MLSAGSGAASAFGSSAVESSEGAVLAFAGVVLYTGGMVVHHHQPTSARFWPWTLLPLSAQVIGAWLIALALAAALAIHQMDLSELLVPSITYTAFGAFQVVAVIWHWPQLERHDLWLWGYLAVLVAIVLTGGYGWRAASRRPRVGDERDRSALAVPAVRTGSRRRDAGS